MPRHCDESYNRQPYPLGTVRLRPRERIRYIKVTHLGPKPKRWMPVALHWWLKNKGPVPEGLRVVHLNGDTLDDRPDNYGLMTGGQVVLLYRRVRKGVMEKMIARRARATARSNRERALVRRALEILPTRWYPIDVEKKLIHNEPRKSRRQLLALHSISVELNGRISHSRLRAIHPITFVRGSLLTTPAYAGYRRSDACAEQINITTRRPRHVGPRIPSPDALLPDACCPFPDDLESEAA